MYYETATVTKTGPGGQLQGHDNSWGAVLADGNPVRVCITAKVQTLKIPTLQVGQVIHVGRHSDTSDRWSVDTSDITWVSPSKLAQLIASNAEVDTSAIE